MPWLFKTEPSTFSFADLLAAPGQTTLYQATLWEGVRNYEARNLRLARVGDPVFIYHSSTHPAGVAGLAVVSREANPTRRSSTLQAPTLTPKRHRTPPAGTPLALKSSSQRRVTSRWRRSGPNPRSGTCGS